MKSTLSTIIALLCFISFNVNGQRLKDSPINIKYVQLPSKKLPKDYKTYSVTASGPLFEQAGVSTGTVAKGIVMDGFKRLDGMGDNVGHLRTQLYGSYIRTGRAEFKTRTSTSKDKDGKETTKKYYWYEIPFNCNTNFRIFNPDGEILRRADFPNNKIMKTKEYSNSTSLTKDRVKLLNQLEADYASETINALKSNTKQSLVNLYDYDYQSARFNIYLIKKHASEQQWEKHYENVAAVFKDAEANTPSSQIKPNLISSFEFYEMHANKDPKGDKKLKRIYKAANYNLALLHFAVDEFDLAREYAAKVIKSENKDRRSRLLTDRIEKWETKMANLDINTIHHFRDIEDALPPSTIAALEAEKEEMEESTTTSSGSVFKGSEEIAGTWSMDKEADDLIFGEGGNIKFVVEENSEMVEVDLTSVDITEFIVADRKFKKIRFSPSAKGQTEASLQILEEIYTSEKIKLFKYYPSTGALSDDKPEFAYQKRNEEFPISLESTQFLLWKKGLAKYFSDCEDLGELVGEGSIAKSKDDLIKAARIYSELCEEVIRP
jgi:hypothetical protein